MPLYEYRCDACERTFEVLQKFSDPPMSTCGDCGGTVTQLLSAPAIQFKGSGWYITDYARKNGGDSPKSDSSSKKESSSSEDKKASSEGSGQAGEKSAAGKGA